MSKSEKLTAMAGTGYVEYGSFEHEESGEIVRTRGWHWRKTPGGEPRGPSYEAEFIGANFAEAEEHFDSGMYGV